MAHGGLTPTDQPWVTRVGWHVVVSTNFAQTGARMTLSRSAIFYALLFALVACGGEPTSPAAPLPQIGGRASPAVGGPTLVRRPPPGSLHDLPNPRPSVLVGR